MLVQKPRSPLPWAWELCLLGQHATSEKGRSAVLHLYEAFSTYSMYLVCTVHLSRPKVSQYFAVKHCGP